jgi:hypothetical protein
MKRNSFLKADSYSDSRYRVHRILPLYFILSQMNPVRNRLSCLFKIHFRTVLLQKTHACYMTYPYTSP